LQKASSREIKKVIGNLRAQSKMCNVSSANLRS
jgi:hypothetical protein